MKVLVMAPNEEPDVREIEGKDLDLQLKQMQQIVDGYITLKATNLSQVAIVCNEDGIPFGLEINRGFYGTFFFVRLDENNDFKGLSEEDIEVLKQIDKLFYM